MDLSGPPPSLLDRNTGHQTRLHDLRTALGRTALFVNRTSSIAASFQGPTRPSDATQPTESAHNLVLKPPPSEHLHRQQQTPPQNRSIPLVPLQNSRTPITSTPVLIPPPSLTPSLTASSLPRPVSVPPLELSRTPMSVLNTKHIVLNSTAKSGGLKNSVLLPHDSTDMNHHPPKSVDLRDKSGVPLEQKGATSVQNGSAMTSQVSSNTSSTVGSASTGVQIDSNLKSDRKPAQNGPTNVQPVPKSDATADAVPQISWLMGGPANNVLLLNSRKSPQPHSSQKKSRSVSMSDAASVITSQFLQNSSKEDNSVTVRANEQLSAPLQASRAVPLAMNRELHLPVVQGTVPMTSSRLPTSLPPTPVTPKLEGHHQMFDKRAASAQSLVARRASTNGSNYPEIFHTARRFSDTTERGLKQALAG